MAQYTKAGFLNDPSRRTPVFVRFSTVAGSRGSTDLARDVRGFSVKFYTEEGNYDLVGNNIPVFFIQDAIKFPDLIHAVKPEPNNEIPQAASAHDTFWDFISLMPESMHMIMWVMSDRAIPRSLRMMEGFGVHTFRLINEAGKSVFVKFHWKPLLGVHSVAWDEAQVISGKDADFHRRDLFDAIESGAFPEWELGIQVVEEKDEHKYPFDLLDPTKLIPEELVPVQRIGKMVLNRNTDNFFAETEQVAFHPGHLVPGIDYHRLGELERKKCGDPLSAAEVEEESKIRARIADRARAIGCPAGYGLKQAQKDSNRLHQLYCKRISPPSCGGGALPDAEDAEEAQLRARLTAFDESPEGCARHRIRDLEMQDFRGGRSVAEQNELDSLRTLYPDLPLDPDNPLTEAFEAWRRVAAE